MKRSIIPLTVKKWHEGIKTSPDYIVDRPPYTWTGPDPAKYPAEYFSMKNCNLVKSILADAEEWRKAREQYAADYAIARERENKEFEEKRMARAAMLEAIEPATMPDIEPGPDIEAIPEPVSNPAAPYLETVQAIMDGPAATKRQTWTLYRLYRKDFRNERLTMAQASGMINRFFENKKAAMV